MTSVYKTAAYREMYGVLEDSDGYDGDGVDRDILPLVTLLNLIPGIETLYSCAGTHDELKCHFYILLRIEPNLAIHFFRRYNSFFERCRRMGACHVDLQVLYWWHEPLLRPDQDGWIQLRIGRYRSQSSLEGSRQAIKVLKQFVEETYFC